MTPAVYAVLAMFGFFVFILVLAGVAYLAFTVIRSINRLTKALEVIAPMLKSEDLVRLTNGFVLMGRQGADMLKKMEALDKTIGLFYSFAVAKDEAENPGKARTSGGGRFSALSDERAAANEAAQNAQESPG